MNCQSITSTWRGSLANYQALQLEVSDFERERETIRRAASSSIHKMAAIPEFARISRYLDYVDRQMSNLVRRTSVLSVEQRRVAWQLQARSAQVQRDVHEARLVPAHNVFQGFRKMVRDLAKSEGKEIEFEAGGLDVRADRMVLQELKDPIMHVLRNCVSHGIESPQLRKDAGKPASGRVRMSLEVANGRLSIVIEDDGRGIDVEADASPGDRAGTSHRDNLAATIQRRPNESRL